MVIQQHYIWLKMEKYQMNNGIIIDSLDMNIITNFIQFRTSYNIKTLKYQNVGDMKLLTKMTIQKQ